MRISLGHCLEYTRKCQFFVVKMLLMVFKQILVKTKTLLSHLSLKILLRKKDIQIGLGNTFYHQVVLFLDIIENWFV